MVCEIYLKFLVLERDLALWPSIGVPKICLLRLAGRMNRRFLRNSRPSASTMYDLLFRLDMIVASMDHLDVFGSWIRTASPGCRGLRMCED